MKHITSDFDISENDLKEILNLSSKIKKNNEAYQDIMKNKTLIMLFELASLRTRVSFEAGFNQLGGHAIFYSIEGGKFTRDESMEDGIVNLSRYCNFIMARVLKQDVIERMSNVATVPVINGMTEVYHPCQNLADLLTIQEHKGKLNDIKISYVGDGGCNTANSTMIGGINSGMKVTVVCPENQKYNPNPTILKKLNNKVEVIHDPYKGVSDADVIYTDVAVSAGMEAEKEERIKAFKPYQVNSELLKKAKENTIVMHCLPAHIGYEITREVMDSPQSVVFDQAENRMHAQKGLLVWLLNK
ncbi:ornithine carbamoyltransferase [Candidatus Bathyarchaeota archaeon]|nr:ornithine carbamoyltransferase [Candidatus Bathyarchaeota archaeon]